MSKYEPLTLKLTPQMQLTLDEIDKKADVLGLNRSQFVATAIKLAIKILTPEAVEKSNKAATDALAEDFLNKR